MRCSRSQECPTTILGERTHARGLQRNRSTTIVSVCGERNASSIKSNSNVLEGPPVRKRWIVVGHDRLSPCWYVWQMQETKLVKSSHVPFELEAKILDIVGELKAVDLSDKEDEPSEKEETSQIDVNNGSGG